jgi:phosphonate metabolism protein/1,5-bisphosphokinase (PRPP-forming) PhnN
MPSPVPEPAGGTLVVVLGPSGVGKDTLLGLAARPLAARSDILFVRRAITRPAHADSEDFLAMSEAEFDHALAEGRLCFSWSANGLRYGLPRAMAAHLEAGGVAVVNGSRAALPAMRKTFADVRVVEIVAEAEAIAARLRARGRESEAEIAARLARAQALARDYAPALVIDNSGEAAAAADRLIAYLREVSTPADAARG